MVEEELASKYLAVVGVSCGGAWRCSGHQGNNGGQTSEKWHSYSQTGYEGFDSHVIRNW